MHRFFSNRRLVIIAVGIITCLGLLTLSVTVRNRRNTPPIIQQFGNDVAGFADRVVSVPVGGVGAGVNSISQLLSTYDENQKLKQQVDQMAQDKVRLQTTENENKELRSEAKLNNSLIDYQPITAGVIARTPSAWQNQLVIGKGKTSGIKKNMPVLAGKGLIGRVIEVNQTNSKVELISDDTDTANRFAIQVTNAGGETVNGIVTGYDKDKNLLEMGQITTKVAIKKGDKVTTSGLGGVTPKGLFVGTIVSTSSDDYGLANKVYIKPAGNLGTVNVVTVAAKQ
ncbi:MAG: rod shape-determining protein MreC [Furfurilactobacillus sp.]|uniref:rod shape-determining protein MreC n=1 Tax=Furfurilactobacillus TaxID=2767882 RepID=UPI001EEDE027|nr:MULTISPECIES: rod shape-determining protein MreC [Furfurilactobacillus]MCF6419047.1 rod shape-determining protein MreC [Furfurilactobacillus milii]MCH4011141.1 rod shape-determining protein MreC [Furfurilactobacillus sp.]MCH4037033.1 rod shape-determining protein MreC [Furfurilactobacillus sp.]MCH4114021.1 rod shape-determining protein MreC [Furfurilactobacillus sp.]MCH4133257.1 rod shape-determining protein MreC [Furfurilactobacillus sp.]